MAAFIHFLESQPTCERLGEVVLVKHAGMTTLALSLPVFRATVFAGMALIRRLDEERQRAAPPIPLRSSAARVRTTPCRGGADVSA